MDVSYRYKIFLAIVSGLIVVLSVFGNVAWANNIENIDSKITDIPKNSNDLEIMDGSKLKQKVPINASINFVELDVPFEGVKIKDGVNISGKLRNLTIDLSDDSTGTDGQRGLGWFWMDFNPGGGTTRDGGLFEGGESWLVTKNVYQDDFDNTDDYIPEWASSGGLYSAVRSDEDLWDSTAQDGAWCTAGGENSGVPWEVEDSRGWAKCEKSFDLGDYVDTTLPGFCFIGDPYNEIIDTNFYCDYKIHGSDFDDTRNHVYFNVYFDDGDREWPLGYNHHVSAGDMPKNDGWCTAFWDPGFQGVYPPGWNHVNPYYEKNDYTKNFVVDYTSGNTQYIYYLWNFFNYFGLQHKLRFELFIRLYGEFIDDEKVKFWVDNAALKLWYWYDEPPFEPYSPDPHDGEHYVDIDKNLKWYGGDPDDYIDPIDQVYYKIYLGLNSNPQLVTTIGPYNADNHGPFTWNPSGLQYDQHYYWKIVAVDSYGLEKSSDLWEFWTENSAPNIPNKPSGQTSGWHSTSYQYSTSAVDPDGHDVYYWLDWGDGSNSGWIGSFSSGQTGSASHSWSSPGTYSVKAKAKDILGAESGWSPSLQVIMGNRDPNPPRTPSGPISGWHGTSYQYSTYTTDPDGDKIKYYFDWGDGNGDWTDLHNSGESADLSYKWNTVGSFEVKAYAEDQFEGISSWCPTILYVYMGNRAPDIPYNPNPDNGDNWVDINADISWECNDPDGDILKYDIYFDTTNPPVLVEEEYPSATYDLGAMQPETAYYWKIKAHDPWDSSSGPIWQFTTRAYNSPVLSNYNSWPEGVDKEWGTYSDLFSFKVHYFDLDGDDPREKYLIVDEQLYEMQGSGSDADYTITLEGSVFGGGEHLYYFYFTDGTISPGARLPTDYDWNFTVNFPPNVPDIAGPTQVKKGKEYTFSALTNDEDEDDIQYWFDWGDNKNTGWVPQLQHVPSGTMISENHTWNDLGKFWVRVKARDIYGDESGWSDPLEVTVPKNNPMLNQIFLQLLERYDSSLFYTFKRCIHKFFNEVFIK